MLTNKKPSGIFRRRRVTTGFDTGFLGRDGMATRLFSLLSQPLYNVIKRDNFLISYPGRKSNVYYA